MNVKDLNSNEYDSFYQTYIEACGVNELLAELKNEVVYEKMRERILSKGAPRGHHNNKTRASALT